MTDQTPPSLIRNLESLLGTGKDRVSVDEIIERVERNQGLAPVVAVLTLPVLLPMPPGVSMVMALPLLLAAPQMMIGRKDLWLPKALGCRSIDTDRLEKGVERVRPWLKRLETVIKPRLPFLTGRAGAVLAGAVCTLMAVVLVLPLPFANLLPAITVLLLSLSLARRDGLTMIAGVAFLAAAVTGIVWGLHGARLGLHRLFG